MPKSELSHALDLIRRLAQAAELTLADAAEATEQQPAPAPAAPAPEREIIYSCQDVDTARDDLEFTLAGSLTVIKTLRDRCRSRITPEERAAIDKICSELVSHIGRSRFKRAA